MKPRWFPAFSAIVLLFTQPFVVALRAEPAAVVEDLGTLGGSQSYAQAINAVGRVAGRSLAHPVLIQGFLTNGAGLDPIPTFGGTQSVANGLNDGGITVGFSRRADSVPRAFRFDPTDASLLDLGTLGGDYAFAYGVNSAGAVVGYAENANQSDEAFVWTPAGMQPLGTLGGSMSWAYGINDAGQIVGESHTADDGFRGFLYSGGSMQELGTPGGPDSAALAINGAGIITGTVIVAGGSRAFRLAPGGAMQELLTLGGSFGSGEGIAPDGTIVGASTNGAGATRACLWKPAGEVVDLNTLIDPTSGWLLTHAAGINGSGQIVGWGLLNSDGPRAFRLTLPAPPAPPGNETLPTIHSLTASPSTLWPANNKLIPVQITAYATDGDGANVPCQIAGVTSNEPGVGDVVLVGPLAVALRATRLGVGDGRVYRIDVACGNSPEAMATGYVEVAVPKSQSGGARK